MASSIPDAALADAIGRIRLIAFDFDGVFTDNAVYVFEDGREAVRCVRSDGIGLRKLDRLGIAYLIISTESNPVVAARSRKLQIRCIQNCDDKRATLDAVRAEMKLGLEQIAFVGNDVNDAPCLTCVGLPIVVHDAHPDAAKHARYVTAAGGGYGAVREICDLFELVLEREPAS
jgi:3-deoxy-D-manno-octulosonate 8-phosphate phosphatase (KDO 8-P phosphatase)